MQELDSEDRAISNEKQKRNEAQEKFEKRNYDLGLKRIKQLESELKGSKNLTEEQRKEKQQQLDAYLARKKQYEEQHGLVVVNGQKEDKAKKKWHDDDLVRRRAEVLAMEDSLAKRLLLINADERIAISKARFEKKTETEIDEIRAEYEEKRRKTLKDEREDRKKLSDDLLEHEKQIKDKILEQKKKELEEQKKLDAEYHELLVKQARLREEIGLEQARERELRDARGLMERIAIQRKYDNLIATIHINSLQQEIFREKLNLEYKRKVSKVSENEERESRNRIIKLENQVDEERRRLADKQADRENAAAERRRQLERESTQMIIQLLGQTENANLRAFANILAAYQQFTDKRDKGEVTWMDKATLGITALSAASAAFFSAESERYTALAQAAADRNQAEMEALQKRHKADLDGFQGNETQKKQLQDRQDREEKALQERQRKEEAALKLKAWKADQAGKISQTISAGALASVQAFFAAGGNPVLGAIFAATIGAFTIAAVAKIAKQKAPKFYATGTEFVDDKREFPSGIDTVPAYLTRGESVLTVQQNKRKQDLGLNNDGLLRTAELYQTLTSRHYFALEGKEYAKTTNPNEKMERLMEGVSRKLDNLKKTNITIDRRGFKVWEAEKNRRIQFLNNQYFGS
ncbi:hypothetical protein BWI93_05380 [Siphonobacter sp. BAB-5385]|nr:hypothetical protein BWI93_05380 [Siphonobacter sp. BAB-5385]